MRKISSFVCVVAAAALLGSSTSFAQGSDQAGPKIQHARCLLSANGSGTPFDVVKGSIKTDMERVKLAEASPSLEVSHQWGRFWYLASFTRNPFARNLGSDQGHASFEVLLDKKLIFKGRSAWPAAKAALGSQAYRFTIKLSEPILIDFEISGRSTETDELEFTCTQSEGKLKGNLMPDSASI